MFATISNDKCRCKCKELIDKGMCDKGFICNPSNCECECDKSCDVGEYLDYKNCKYRKDRCRGKPRPVRLGNPIIPVK